MATATGTELIQDWKPGHLPQGWKGPKRLPLLSRELHGKWNSCDVNWCPCGMLAPEAEA